MPVFTTICLFLSGAIVGGAYMAALITRAPHLFFLKHKDQRWKGKRENNNEDN